MIMPFSHNSSLVSKDVCDSNKVNRQTTLLQQIANAYPG